jgi:hypothetical protein
MPVEKPEPPKPSGSGPGSRPTHWQTPDSESETPKSSGSGPGDTKPPTMKPRHAKGKIGNKG